jgi:hypothetical protein
MATVSYTTSRDTTPQKALGRLPGLPQQMPSLRTGPEPGQRLRAVGGALETPEISALQVRWPSARPSLVGTGRPAGERAAPGELSGIRLGVVRRHEKLTR